MITTFEGTPLGQPTSSEDKKLMIYLRLSSDGNLLPEMNVQVDYFFRKLR